MRENIILKNQALPALIQSAAMVASDPGVESQSGYGKVFLQLSDVYLARVRWMRSLKERLRAENSPEELDLELLESAQKPTVDLLFHAEKLERSPGR